MGGSCRYVLQLPLGPIGLGPAGPLGRCRGVGRGHMFLQLPLRPIGLRPAGPHGRCRGVGRGHVRASAATPHRPWAGRAARALPRGGSKSHEGDITVRAKHAK